ncbi:protein of unknown function [Acidithiobacillus ferrivorans]|uniref:Uncharacterized protein n=1 Tax=Acidithiobacillus ferrivorans TaxID=160808 RepID=A0A060UZA1_9PROT|nr:hypothetical protein AFERRI_600030 [Acidithiobacillus ferrivorans]SMH65363.1 protein of unknown function [Acidithiobacillus ferrivorans]
MVTTADGIAEVSAATVMADDLCGTQRSTLGDNKSCDYRDFVQVLREKHVTPHMTRKRQGSAVDGLTTRHPGYVMNINARRSIKSIFRCMKTVREAMKNPLPGPVARPSSLRRDGNGLQHPAYFSDDDGLTGIGVLDIRESVRILTETVRRAPVSASWSGVLDSGTVIKCFTKIFQHALKPRGVAIRRKTWFKSAKRHPPPGVIPSGLPRKNPAWARLWAMENSGSPPARVSSPKYFTRASTFPRSATSVLSSPMVRDSGRS